MGSSRPFWAKYRQSSGRAARNPDAVRLLTYRPVIGEVVPAEKGKGMSLARAEGPFQQGATAAAGGGSAVVIAVAPRAEERLRLAQMIGDHASVVLVGTRAEAIAVLLGELPGLPAKQEPMFGVPPAAPAPGPAPRPARSVDSDLRIATWEGRSVPALAAGARRALLPARRARPHLAVRGAAPPGLGERPPRRPLRRAVGRQAAAPQAARARLPDARSTPCAASGSGWSTGATLRGVSRRAHP